MDFSSPARKRLLSSARELKPRGASRLERALGVVSVSILALLWSRSIAAPIGNAIILRSGAKKLATNIPWATIPDKEIVDGQLQYLAFMIALGLVIVSVAAFAGVERLAEKLTPRGVGARVLRGIAVVAALVLAHKASPFLGTFATITLFSLAVTVAAHTSGGRAHIVANPLTGLAMVVCAEGLTTGWTLYIMMAREYGPVMAVPAIVVVVYAAFRAGGFLAKPGATDPLGTLRLDAITGAPCLFLPLTGMMRDPSTRWIFAAIALGLVLRAVARRFPAEVQLERTTAFLTSTVAPWAAFGMFAIPLRFRDLASINMHGHEGIHLGWISSALFGKFMMADASTVYGPLREYSLIVFAALTGVTLEHVRICHILLNLAGFGFMLAAGWRVSGGRPWLHVLYAWLLLAHTQLVFFVTYRTSISFGWADLAREGLPSLALVGALAAAERTLARARPENADLKRLAAWGVFVGVSILYSHDFGLCAFGAFGLAIFGEAFLRRSALRFVDGLKRAFALSVAFTAGTLTPLVLFFLVYAVCGRGGLLLRSLVTWSGLLATGAWSGMTYPVNGDSLLDKTVLIAQTRGDGPVFDFIVPLVLMIVAAVVVTAVAVRRTWSARTTLLLALLLFSLTSFRHALLRSEIYHLKGCGTPSLLLALCLMTEMAGYVLHFTRGRRLTFPLGGVVAVGLVAGWAYIADTPRSFRDKAQRMVTNDELPSTGPKYVYDDLPRAGDELIPADVLAVVRFVREQTTRHDPVLVSYEFIQGGEYSFLTDRRNPTRFDVPHEIVTASHQKEVLDALKNDPPALILGEYFALFNEETRDYIHANWQRIPVPGNPGFPMWKYVPPRDPTQAVK